MHRIVFKIQTNGLNGLFQYARSMVASDWLFISEDKKIVLPYNHNRPLG